MEKSKEILDELQSVSPTLALIEKVNVFKVPEEYFNESSQRISTLVFLNQSKANDTRATVPEGYFDGLSNKIISRIKNIETNAEEEIKNISPLLYSLKNKNVWNVPKGYFENINVKILNKINHKSAKVISINAGRRWWKYAAAAIIASVVTIGSLQVFNHKSLQDNVNQIVTSSSTNIPDYIQLSFQYETPEQLDKGIASLSDDEIVRYLEHHGNIMDNDLLIKDIDTKELPEADEYLIDENTLNNFLDMINAPNTN